MLKNKVIDCGPAIYVNRPVRNRMPGGVGAGGAPRLPDSVSPGFFNYIGDTSYPANLAVYLAGFSLAAARVSLEPLVSRRWLT